MSAVTLERTRIRILKELLLQGVAARVHARSLYAACSALYDAGRDWRTPEILRGDLPGMPATSRFLREVAARLHRPGHALARFLRRIENDESRLRHMLTELALCFGNIGDEKAKAEFSAFWEEISPGGLPANEVISMVAAGKQPPFPSPMPAPQVSAVAP
jgi:hypothetical protein